MMKLKNTDIKCTPYMVISTGLISINSSVKKTKTNAHALNLHWSRPELMNKV